MAAGIIGGIVIGNIEVEALPTPLWPPAVAGFSLSYRDPDHAAARLVLFVCVRLAIAAFASEYPARIPFRLPVYPDQRTFSEPVGMSQRCQRTNPLPREGAAARSVVLHLPQ
jgi:hypothetical protein